MVGPDLRFPRGKLSQLPIRGLMPSRGKQAVSGAHICTHGDDGRRAKGERVAAGLPFEALKECGAEGSRGA